MGFPERGRAEYERTARSLSTACLEDAEDRHCQWHGRWLVALPNQMQHSVTGIRRNAAREGWRRYDAFSTARIAAEPTNWGDAGRERRRARVSCAAGSLDDCDAGQHYGRGEEDGRDEVLAHEEHYPHDCQEGLRKPQLAGAGDADVAHSAVPDSRSSRTARRLRCTPFLRSRSR